MSDCKCETCENSNDCKQKFGVNFQYNFATETCNFNWKSLVRLRHKRYGI